MRCRLVVALFCLICSAAADAEAVECPNSPEDYGAEISALQSKQRPLSEELNRSTDTATAIVLANRSIALEERISAIEHRMFECDSIGRLNKQ